MVELEGVTKIYKRGEEPVVALDRVSLKFEAGKMTAIVGPSGCGKSTLLNLIAGLDRPTSGRILLAGRDTSRMGDSEWTRLRREVIAFVFQFFNLLPLLSAKENVSLPLLLRGEPRRPALKKAVMRLEEIGLSRRLDHLPHQLSGGEMQRVAIARARAMEAPLILADEPTGNLDTRMGEEILLLLRESAERGATVLIATHSPAGSAAAHGLVRLIDGRVT